MPCRGVRGATTAKSNCRAAILAATRELLTRVVQLNGIEAEDVASAIFTTTRDLNAEFPALASRQFGWLEVPLLCSHEIEVPGALAQCIRILVFWNTEKLQGDVQHVYVRGAESLRPDMK